MQVFALFADGTASEVVLELCAPDPGGDPVKAAVVGADDAAIRVSAERAVKTGYFLLTRRGYDAGKLRYFASFDLNVPAGAPVSGDSAGAAFLVKFLTAVIERESGRDYGSEAVAATGVITEASADARVARVDGIMEKIRAAFSALPPRSPILLPSENMAELRETGALAELPRGAVSRLKSLGNIGDVMDWVDSIMPLESHLPARTRIAPAAVSAASLRDGTPPVSPKPGMSLWRKRLLLYACSFCVGPLMLLTAILAQGRAGMTPPASEPALPVSPVFTPQLPADISALKADMPETPAAKILDGYFEYEISRGTRDRVRLQGERYVRLDAPLSTGFQTALRSLQFSDATYFYMISCEPREPSLALHFPRPGSAFANPLSPSGMGGPYDFPAFSLGNLPPDTASVFETIYLVSSSRPRPDIEAQIREFQDHIFNGNVPKARIILQQAVETLESRQSDLEVLKIQFEHVEPASGRTREATSSDTLHIE